MALRGSHMVVSSRTFLFLSDSSLVHSDSRRPGKCPNQPYLKYFLSSSSNILDLKEPSYILLRLTSLSSILFLLANCVSGSLFTCCMRSDLWQMVIIIMECTYLRTLEALALQPPIASILLDMTSGVHGMIVYGFNNHWKLSTNRQPAKKRCV